MALTDNIVAYWSLDEASGNRADSVGTATLVDNSTVPSATGIISNGADFTGTSGEFLSVTNAALNIQNDFSLSFWAQSDALTTFQRILTAYDGANAGRFEVYQEANAELRFVYWNSAGSGRTLWRTTAAQVTGSLKHFVITCDVSNTTTGGKIYVNGSSVSVATSATAATSWGDNSGIYGMGGWVDGTQPWNGIIDEFGVWSRILTTDEVTELYNSGAGLAYPFSGGGGATFIPRSQWLT